MTAGFYPDVFAVFRANFAKLESRSHLAVKLVLLLTDLNVILGGSLYCPTQVRVNTPAIRVQITNSLR
jgi:hypothetical protein